MGQKFIELLILIIEMLPFIFGFSVVGYIMYNNSKGRVDVSIKGMVFSWSFFAFYVLDFGSIFIFFLFGKKLWGIISSIVLVASLVLLIAIHFIKGAINKRKIKVGERKTVQAKLIGAVEEQSKSRTMTGAEPKSENYFSLVFEYLDDGKKQICTTNKLYTLSQVAYINKLKEIPTITVCKNICEVEDYIPMYPPSYDLEDIKDLKISRIESVSNTAQYYIEIFAVLSFTIPTFITMFLTSLVTWGNDQFVSIGIMSLGLVSIILPTIIIFYICRIRIKVIKYGAETYALEFANVGKTNAVATYCDIKYTYETSKGIKTKKERVTMDVYGIIKQIKRLPIKVYKKWAIIDIDKIKQF